MNTIVQPVIRSIAVFCGSNFGVLPEYGDYARALGQVIAHRGIRLIYGGTDKGLMGVVAGAAIDAGGEVVGVITERLLERGHLSARLTQHEVVADMRSRKARMTELADAFIALPGGLGTLEELLEAATLTQLGDHLKPCGVLNVCGFFEPLFSMLALATDQGFMKVEHRDMLVFSAEPADLLDKIDRWRAPAVTKWIGQPGA